MRNKFAPFAIILIWITACQTDSKITGEFRILPSPQSFETSGISDLKYDDIDSFFSTDDSSLPARGDLLRGLKKAQGEKSADILISVDKSLDLHAEGYVLEIHKDKIEIVAKDEAGLLYGFMTLQQMMEDSKEQDVHLPQCVITDHPKLSYRAIHLDVKHHLEKTEYYYQLMDRLASYKINAVILELEDKIKYERQPLIGSDDALSIQEWQKLGDYAKERNIEISPLVQGLGHASFILKHDEYKDLRDDPKSDWAFNPLDPRTYEVQYDLYLDAIAATPHGRYLHIGGDEVHTTGQGAEKSSMELQMIWLNRVCRFAEEQGRIPIFWDDMPLKHAGLYGPMYNRNLTSSQVDSIWLENESNLTEFIDEFPKNCIYMRWNYHTPETYGNLKAMDWFSTNGFQVIGATAGQTRWVLMPQNESNIENIRSFALSSIERNLNGLLLTLWDDDSPHFELYFRGILAFSEYSWSGDIRSIADFKTAHRHREFGQAVADQSFSFIDKLEEPVQYWKNVLVKEDANRNYLTSMTDPQTGVLDMPIPSNKGYWSSRNTKRLATAKEMVKKSDSISSLIKNLQESAVRNKYTLEVYEQVNGLVKFSFETLLRLENYDNPSEVISEQEAMEALREIRARFESLRKKFEEVYGETRILIKPADYILDQDHHKHSANQTTNFDWQFTAELMLLEKLDKLVTSESEVVK